ncbi:MAG: hypothetical protein ACOY45_06520 [Pseudomonadota bacterium]
MRRGSGGCRPAHDALGRGALHGAARDALFLDGVDLRLALFDALLGDMDGSAAQHGATARAGTKFSQGHPNRHGNPTDRYRCVHDIAPGTAPGHVRQVQNKALSAITLTTVCTVLLRHSRFFDAN